MLQANKHISLVCREPGSLSTFNIILLSERGFHCLLSITPLSLLIKQCLFLFPDLRYPYLVSDRDPGSPSAGSRQWPAQCTLITLRPVLSQCLGACHLSFSQSWATHALSHVTQCQVHLTRDMSLSSPGLS